MINYELGNQESSKLKAALTRAEKKGYEAVLAACKHAVTRWNVWGAWPDNWSRWQRALDDAAYAAQRAGVVIYPQRMEEL